MNLFSVFRFMFGGSSLQNRYGTQLSLPMTTIIDDLPATNYDTALQVSAIWRGVELISKTIATLPILVYDSKNGNRDVARDSSLWTVLHDSPNSRMTPCEFWTAMIMNLLLRGNGYARIVRNEKTGEAEALWPMPADQIEFKVLKDGTEVYYYRIDSDLSILAAENVLHIKEMGNGTIGLSRLDYMRASVGEAINSQRAANKLFANGGKATGILMVDSVLKKEQRQALQESFSEMTSGPSNRLFVLEANMKFQALNLTPEDMQLLATRKFTIDDIGRWIATPSIMLNQNEGSTTLGSSTEGIMENWYKTTIRALVIAVEQAIIKRVMTSHQRVTQTIEFNMDGVLRSNQAARFDTYSKGVQNGLFSRNECRQLENMPPFDGGDEYTAQSNLMPVNKLGTLAPTGGTVGTQNAITQ